MRGAPEWIKLWTRLQFASALSQYGEKIMEEQETAAIIADLAIAAYASESAWHRYLQSPKPLAVTLAAVHSYASEAYHWSAIASSHTATPSPTLPGTVFPAHVMIANHRLVADAVIDRGGYPW